MGVGEKRMPLLKLSDNEGKLHVSSCQTCPTTQPNCKVQQAENAHCKSQAGKPNYSNEASLYSSGLGRLLAPPRALSRGGGE